VVALACSAPPGGRTRWTIRLLTATRGHARTGQCQSEDGAADVKNTTASPAQADVVHRPITAEYRDRMYALLGLYARPHDAQEPVVCVDEKSKQLLRQARTPILRSLAGAPRGLRMQTGRDAQHLCGS